MHQPLVAINKRNDLCFINVFCFTSINQFHQYQFFETEFSIFLLISQYKLCKQKAFMSKAPLANNEWSRVLNLADYNLDYSTFENNFRDLARLAAKVAGTNISLVNLIDSYTQWTISSHGLDIEQMPREESVCQYTILEQDHFEVQNLAEDNRFKDKDYVVNAPSLRYYYGIPLKSDGYNIGALCVMDKQPQALTPEKVELLKLIGEEIVNRLKVYKVVESLRNKVTETQDTQNKVAHDIRGPLAGIIGLSKIVADQGTSLDINEIMEFINLIYKSSKSLLELTDEILNANKTMNKDVPGNELDLEVFRNKLLKLYVPQAMSKKVAFDVQVNLHTTHIVFPQNKLIQIIGNLISNAIKFTPAGGTVTATLNLKKDNNANVLQLMVSDTGIGLDKEQINALLSGAADSTIGTAGERGYGFGLALVQHLVKTLKGTFQITSAIGQGASFIVEIPV